MEGTRRQVHRREPIETELDSGAVFTAKPLRWQERNDLGDLIMQEHIRSTNESIRLIKDENDLPDYVEGGFNEKLKNYDKILEAAYPDNKFEDFVPLDFDEMIALILAALEVNGLADRLAQVVDPNYHGPVGISGNSSQGPEDGLKTTSSPDSSLPGSDVTKLSSSPSTKSSTS